MKRILLLLLVSLRAVAGVWADETIFADYFDIEVGSKPGTEVTGRIHLERNKDVRTNPVPDGYNFAITRQEDGRDFFSIATERDPEGRIMGVLAVKDGVTLPSEPSLYTVTVALRDGDRALREFPVRINAARETVWRTLYDRYLPKVNKTARMYGRVKLSDAEVAAFIADLKSGKGRFSDVPCYDRHPAEYPGRIDELDHSKGGTIDYDYMRVCERVGQLGYAYVNSPVYGVNGNPSKHAELRDAIIDALLAYTSVFPIEGDDVLVNGKPVGRYMGDGFSKLYDHKLAGRQIATHQWTITDPLMMPVLNLMPEILEGVSRGDARMRRLHDALIRYLQVFTSVIEERRAIDNPDGRWGLISDPDYSSGAWADANLGHRLRTMLALPLIWADYNRPMTYVPYWYGDFYKEKPYEGFNFAHGWSPKGVMSDVAHWMSSFVVPAHRYRQSGFQPDGTISHHIGNATDAAMAAYGFGWLTDIMTGYDYFKGTPWEIPSDGSRFVLDRLLRVYPVLFYEQRMDNLVSGRSFLQDPKHFVLTEYARGAKGLLRSIGKRSENSGADSLRRTLKAISDNNFGMTATVPFWVNEFLVHRGGGDDGVKPFYVSVKLKSKRTVGAEDFDKKVRKSWHMGYGVMQTKVKGDEYDQPVLARFDWHALPGLTEEWREDPLPIKGGSQASKPGENDVAGVLADGVAGMAIYHHLPGEDYSSARAFKSYGFIGPNAISQGSGISRRRAGTGKSIMTFIDQGSLASPLTVSAGGQTTIVPTGGDADLEFKSSEPMWVHIGAKGYVILPDGETSLRVVTGKHVNVTDPGYKVKGKSCPGFIIGIDHGVNPAAGSYAYAVLPNATAAGMPGLVDGFVKDFAFNHDSDAGHALYSASAKVRQFAFFGPGRLEIGGVTATAEAPAQVMLRETADSYILSAGNPAPDHEKATSMSFTLSKRLPSGTYPYRVGGVYPLEGETVTVADEGDGSRVTIELPDSRDEAKYHYQTELYNAAPVVVAIPKGEWR